MKRFSKRIITLNSLVQKKNFECEEAVKLIKKLQTAKFIESVEAHIRLNLDPKYANQQLRTSLVLPYGNGKNLRIAVFTETENVSSALSMGANLAGQDDLFEEISQGKINFDVLLTTPLLVPKLGKLGKILGPKSLMPSLKSGTVTQNLKETIEEFKKGKLEYRADKNGIVHITFGKTSFSEEQLLANLVTLYNSIEKNKPAGVKGKYFHSFYICTTMSPSVKIDLPSFKTIL